MGADKCKIWKLNSRNDRDVFIMQQAHRSLLLPLRNVSFQLQCFQIFPDRHIVQQIACRLGPLGWWPFWSLSVELVVYLARLEWGESERERSRQTGNIFNKSPGGQEVEFVGKRNVCENVCELVSGQR